MILFAVDAHRLNVWTFLRCCFTRRTDVSSGFVWCSAYLTPCFFCAACSMMTKAIALAALICRLNPSKPLGFRASTIDPESSIDDLLCQFMIAYRNDY